MQWNYLWNVYLERADDDEPARYIGTIHAGSMGDALQKASQYYEVPSHDLVVKRADDPREQERRPTNEPK